MFVIDKIICYCTCSHVLFDIFDRSIDVVIPSFPATRSNELYYSVSPRPKRANFIEYLFKLLKYVYIDHDFCTCGGS